MERRPRGSQHDLARQVNDPLTAITALLGVADASTDSPDELRRCLAQIGVLLKELAVVCHHLVSQADIAPVQLARGSATVVGGTRSDLTPAQKLAGVLEPDIAAVREADGGQRAALDPELAAQLIERLRPSATHRPEQLPRLTPQERRIFVLIGQGCTNRQIAQQLFLAEKTVKNYVSNMLRKLGMERRTQAAVFASALDRRQWPIAPGTSRPA